GTPASLRSGKALVSIYADAFGNVKQKLVYASLQATWVRYKSPVFTWSQWVRLATANDQGVVDFAHGGTGGNSKAAAQTSLGIEMPSNGSIAPGINLDQFKGDGYKGYWRQPLTTAASNAGANYPVPEAGLLTVEVSGANGNGTTQTYRTWETNQEFTRTWQAVQGNVNMGKWSPWHTKLNAFVIDNFFLKPDGSQDPDAAKNGWDKAHPPTRGVMTNIYFHPQPSKLKNTVSTPQYLDPPTNKVPNPDYPGYQDANAPWGFGINDKDRSLQIWGGPTESATPDYTSGLEGITGSRRFQIGAMTQVVTSNPVGAVQIKNPGGYQYFTVTLPNGFLTTRNPDGSGGTGLASDSIGAIRMGGNASTGAVQIDACYQGALKWNGNKAKTGGDISSEWNTALEPSLAQ
ncbi:pyocin knob domain-containing protein, partial [Herbiconiux daphne]